MARETNGSARLPAWLRLMLQLAILLAMMAAAWAAMDGKVNRNSEVSGKARDKADANERCVIKMQTDIEYIKKAMDASSRVQEQILAELRARPVKE